MKALVVAALERGLLFMAHEITCFKAYGILPDQGLNLHWQADSQPLEVPSRLYFEDITHVSAGYSG